MRTKEEILKQTREDINNEQHKEAAPLWVQYTLIEAILDIRDILNKFIQEEETLILEMSKKVPL